MACQEFLVVQIGFPMFRDNRTEEIQLAGGREDA
jgi:hypothetical protein